MEPGEAFASAEELRSVSSRSEPAEETPAHRVLKKLDTACRLAASKGRRGALKFDAPAELKAKIGFRARLGRGAEPPDSRGAASFYPKDVWRRGDRRFCRLARSRLFRDSSRTVFGVAELTRLLGRHTGYAPRREERPQRA